LESVPVVSVAAAAAHGAIRIVLVGTPAERAKLRARMLAAANGRPREPEPFAVVAEFSSLAAARSSSIRADAILIAPDPSIPASSHVDDRVGPETLTPREIDVLELLAEGLPNKAIAARLRISDQTVKFHVSSICGKLAAANRTDAVRRAIRQGLITV
jgi:DNA-binding NarL/FixJ family response regulator